jgi:N-acetylmuramoyl-L-alanine amidase
MPSILLYLLKTIACSGILFAYYQTALCNRSFHRWNRYFLLATVVISIVLPLISVNINIQSAFTITEEVTLLQVGEPGNMSGHDEIATATTFFNWNNLAILIYLVITGFLIAALAAEIYRLRLLAKISPKQNLNDLTIVFTEEKNAPFSWFRKIFWNDKIDIKSELGIDILHHETVHVRQLHSADRLFMNIAAAIFWINPFYWLIRKELTTIHEFIADEASVKKGDDSRFSEMLLACSYPGHHFNSISQFNSSSIKRRMLMLKKIKSSAAYHGRFLTIPVLFILFAAFSVHTRNTPILPDASGKGFTIVIDAGHGGTSNGAVASDGTSEKEITLALAKKIKELNSYDDIHIVLTRESDKVIESQDRVSQALQQKADAFISLHMSAAGDSPPGIELVVSDKQSSYNKESQILGSIFSRELQKVYEVASTIKKGRVDGGIWVLDAPAINYPTLLIECGKITDEKDLAFVKSANNREKLAKQILKAIRTFTDTKKIGVTIVNDTLPTRAQGLALTVEKGKISLTLSNGKVIRADGASLVSVSATSIFIENLEQTKDSAVIIYDGKLVSDLSQKDMEKARIMQSVAIIDIGEKKRLYLLSSDPNKPLLDIK